MITTREERKAIHEVGVIFSEWGWGFRELDQDWGCDVLIEMSYEGECPVNWDFCKLKGVKVNFIMEIKELLFIFLQSTAIIGWLLLNGILFLLFWMIFITSRYTGFW